MSYNGSGTFNINTTGQPVVAGTVITASAFNALTADLATGLTTAITKDGQTTTTARIPFAQGINSSLVTDASSTSTGSIITAGGVGIAKALYVGTTANVAGAVTLGGIATFSAQPIFSSLTASSAVATDASKGLVSVTNTGTGNNVLATSPTIATPTITGDASISGLTVGKGNGSIVGNTTLGASALAGGSQTGTSLTALGFGTLNVNSSGNYNTAVGASALQNNGTASDNTATGFQALFNNSTGADNTASGFQSLVLNTTGANNTAFGSAALKSNTTASNNTAVGYQALYTTATGDNNTALGYQALYNSNRTADNNDANTAVGYQAGLSKTTGNNNSFFGKNAGSNLTTGSANIYIGQGSAASAVGNGSEIVIGTQATGKGSSTFFVTAGGGPSYNGGNTTSWTTTSDQRLKKNIADNTDGLSKITGIRVRNFEYRSAEEVTELPSHAVIDKQGVQLGVIAQELQQVLPDCVHTESTGVMSVQTDNLTWYMINAIKELKAEFDAYKATHP